MPPQPSDPEGRLEEALERWLGFSVTVDRWPRLGPKEAALVEPSTGKVPARIVDIKPPAPDPQEMAPSADAEVAGAHVASVQMEAAMREMGRVWGFEKLERQVQQALVRVRREMGDPNWIG